jgi:hypothetical protein
MLYSRLVPAFEEIDVVEQASGEELSFVGSRPDVGVVKPELVISSEQDKPRCILTFLEFYELLSLVLWFTALSN